MVAAVEASKFELQAADGLPMAYLRGMPEPWDACEVFEEDLLAGRHKQAAAIFQQSYLACQDLVETALHLVQPALYRIGQKWQENRISVSREHLATAIAQSILARGYSHAQPVLPRNGKVVLACVAGNDHGVLGLTMVADALEQEGWEVFNLGANNPTGSIVTMVPRLAPSSSGFRSLCRSTSRPPGRRLSQLNEPRGKGPSRVMLGGVAINQFEPPASLLGARFGTTIGRERICEYCTSTAWNPNSRPSASND